MTAILRRMARMVCCFVTAVSSAIASAAESSTTPAAVPHRGMYEIVLHAEGEIGNPYFDSEFQVTFVRPDGSKAMVDGFFDGDSTFKARAYCDAIGQWSWASTAKTAGLDGRSGKFEVVPSKLPGKLRKHPKDPHQFAYDNGEWFLHIGDTGYRYVTQSEPKWREYIDQAAKMGATKIRTWFCQSRGGVEALFSPDRSRLNLPYWQEIDRRVAYALSRHPTVILKLIPYGEDTAELLRYGKGDKASQLVARYAQARFSAYPNVMWCISNDRELVADGQPLTGRRVPASAIDRIGRDMAAREPWGTLLTNHQARFTGYSFTDAPWSDVVTIEDIDEVAGLKLLTHRAKSDDPVVNDEDRYELYKPPADVRYFFRRLMWASLLSGGHATYGGLRTYEPYDGGDRGVQGYYDAKAAGKLTGGADDFVHIHAFFRDAGLTLVGLTPDDAAVGNQPAKAKCISDDRVRIVYLANPSGKRPDTDRPAKSAASVKIKLPPQSFRLRWFDPTSGRWSEGPAVRGSEATLLAPGPGDWVGLLQCTEIL